MSDCDSQKNIKKPIDERSTVDNVKKPIEDGLFMISVATTVGIVYALMVAGAGQHNALLTSTPLA